MRYSTCIKAARLSCLIIIMYITIFAAQALPLSLLEPDIDFKYFGLDLPGPMVQVVSLLDNPTKLQAFHMPLP